MTFCICSSCAPSCITTTIYLLLRFVPLDPAALVNDSLEQPLQSFFIQRPAVLLFHAPKNFALTFRVINTHVMCFLDLSNFNHASSSFVQQLEKPYINIIDALAPVFDAH